MARERHEDALKNLSVLHEKKGEEFIQREIVEIRGQLGLEQAQRSQSSWAELFTLRYARRVLLGCFIMNMTKLSGGMLAPALRTVLLRTPINSSSIVAGGVVQNYQSLFYAGLGFQGRTILLLSGCYGFMGIIGQVINMLWVSDKWPRKQTMCKPPFFCFMIIKWCQD